ncbi:MAG TPA: mechanosensitive ion channel domain-containing protein [Sphingobacteriaceae bacterium]
MNDQFLNLSDDLPAFAWNLIIAAAAILVGVLLKLLFNLIVKLNWIKQPDYRFIKSKAALLSKPLNFLLPVLALNFGLKIMRLSPAVLKPLNQVIEILLIIGFSAILINIFRMFEEYILYKYDISQADNLKARKIRTQFQFIRKVLIALIVIVTVAVILLSFPNMRKIGAGLLTGVGIGSVIIGFAAQHSLTNFLAGLQIAFTQPIRIDDILIVEGEWGKVEEITLTYVVLNIWDQRRLILPIRYFIEKPFQNWTRSTSEILGSVFIYADFTVPVGRIRTEFTRLVEQNPLWDKRVAVLQVTDLKERTLEMRALVSARNSGDAFDLRCYVRENLITYINENFSENLPKIRTESRGFPPPDAGGSDA